MARTFKMNGNTYTSMSKIAEELGVTRVRPKDFDKYGITEILEPEAKQPDDKKPEAKQPDDKKPEAKQPDDKASVISSWEANGGIIITPQLDLPYFAKLLRGLSSDCLVTYAKSEGLDTFENISNESIRKMRLIMTLKTHFYPDDKLESKKASDFRKIPLEALMDKADELGLVYRRCSQNCYIQRMWVTRALIDSNVSADTIPVVQESNNGGVKQ